MLAGFCAYFFMYVFRKPFSAASFEGVHGWPFALDYKIALVIARAAGYAVAVRPNGGLQRADGQCGLPDLRGRRLGYIGSVSLPLWRNFGGVKLDWLQVFTLSA